MVWLYEAMKMMSSPARRDAYDNFVGDAVCHSGGVDDCGDDNAKNKW